MSSFIFTPSCTIIIIIMRVCVCKLCGKQNVMMNAIGISNCNQKFTIWSIIFIAMLLHSHGELPQFWVVSIKFQWKNWLLLHSSVYHKKSYSIMSRPRKVVEIFIAMSRDTYVLNSQKSLAISHIVQIQNVSRVISFLSENKTLTDTHQMNLKICENTKMMLLELHLC